MSQYEQLIKEFGFPVVVIMGIIWGLIKVAVWMSPRLDRLIDSFIEQDKKMRTYLESHLEKNEVLLSKHSDSLKKHTDLLEKIYKKIQEL